MGFHERMRLGWATNDSLLCVGLDPDLAAMPAPLAGRSDAIVAFCRAIVDATADVVCAYKPQIAHFAAQRAEPALEEICAYIRERAPHAVLVLDAKRGDIGSTAAFYAEEAFGRYGADCVTINPYLGTDAATPFLERGGVLGLCRTSNAGSGEVQDLLVDGMPLYQRVAAMIAERWAEIGEPGLVVGATYPSQLREVRAIVGDLPVLLPGVGFQGGDVAASVQAGCTPDGTGLLASSSRAILYASSGEDFAEAARAEAIRTRDALRAAIAITA